MRTFEVVLILVNLLPLLLAYTRQPKIVWLGGATVNLAILLIHGLFEGIRYQMAFAYVFVILFVVFAFVKTNDRLYIANTPKIIKGVVVGLSFILLLLTAFLASALPVFTLSQPTGRYAIGATYIHLVDESRTEPFLDGSTQNRELMVKVYYPAEKNDSKPLAPYFHSSEFIRLFTTSLGMPDFIFSHLNLVKTHSKENLQIANEQQSYPVILFSHGAGMTMETQTSQSEDLASHGYMVVVIDHTYASVATIFPDRTVLHKEATTDFNTAEPAEIITQIMADDSKFVIEKLSEMNEGKIVPIFAGKIDLTSIGVIGHSVGGAVAYNLAINDNRVKAAINLDGVVFVTPKENTEDMAPFLMIANDKYHMQAIRNRESLMKLFEDMPAEEQDITVWMYGSEEAYREAYNKAQQNMVGLSEVLQASGDLFTIEGSDHMKFIDIGLFIGVSWLRELMSIGGNSDPARCLEITKAVTLIFFDEHLRGETRNSLDRLASEYPELKRVDW